MNQSKFDFTIETLGPCKIQSPIHLSKVHGDFVANYVTDEEFIINRVDTTLEETESPCKRKEVLEKAGPVFVPD